MKGNCIAVSFSLKDKVLFAALAQSVEHIIRNDGVRCSSHLSGTIPNLF
jgi:hypothetical protein